MKIAAISSEKLGDVNEGMLDNKNLYNDKELFDDADLDWYDYGFRNYDAQIGRFTQLDPLTDDYPYYAPYQYAGNEPIANMYLDGLEELPMVTVVGYIHKIAPAANGVNTISKISTIASLAANTLNISAEILKAIEPNGVRYDEEAYYLNQYWGIFGIETKKQMAHFIAQTDAETGGNRDLDEGYSQYSFRNLKAKRGEDGYINGISNHFVGLTDEEIRGYVGTPQVLDRAYGRSSIGNGPESSGDGSKYRGRGLTQLTGKEDYTAFNNWYHKKFNDYSIDFLKDPELISDNMKFAVIKGLWDFP